MKKAMTMIELIFVIAIVVGVIAALLNSLVACLALNENSRMMTIAVNIARDKMEEIISNKSQWDSIVHASYPIGALSKPPAEGGYNFNGSCEVAVADVNSNFKLVRVVVCWRLKNGRIVGTDSNLNGSWEVGEPIFNWSPAGGVIQVINSPVAITTSLLKG